MSRRSVRPVELAKLIDLATERLLAYRDKLLRLEESAASSDCSAAEVALMDPALMHFKEDARWQPLYQAVIDTLSTRPHISRG